MTDDEYKLLEPDVKTAAKTTAREWDGIIETDDAEQEIWVRLLESPSSLAEISGMDQAARVSALTRIGRQIGSGYRDDYGYFSGNYQYSANEVREMLDRGALEANPTDGDFGSDMPPIWEYEASIIQQFERTDTETATQRIDLALGMRGLRDAASPYFAIIVNKFRNGIGPDHWKTTTRAVDALTHEMNRVNTRRKANYEQGPGTRKAMSNDQAQKLTRNEYSQSR